MSIIEQITEKAFVEMREIHTWTFTKTKNLTINGSLCDYGQFTYYSDKYYFKHAIKIEDWVFVVQCPKIEVIDQLGYGDLQDKCYYIAYNDNRLFLLAMSTDKSIDNFVKFIKKEIWNIFHTDTGQ